MSRWKNLKHEVLYFLGIHSTFSDCIVDNRGRIIKIGFTCNHCEWTTIKDDQ